MTRYWISYIVAALCFVSHSAWGGGVRLRRFTVVDEIGLTHFNQWYSDASPIRFSPNGKFVSIWAERGLLKEDLVQDELRVYSVRRLKEGLTRTGTSEPVKPVLDLRESTYKEGPIIGDIQWLHDSRGLVFLLKSGQGEDRLAMIGLKRGRVRMLSLAGQVVTAFGVRDGDHYVYTVRAPGADVRPLQGSGRAYMDATGDSLFNLLFPDGMLAREALIGMGVRSVLWAATGGAPHPVVSSTNGRHIVLYPERRLLALSPDGRAVVTELPVPRVPSNWVREFPPPPGFYSTMRAGPQNLNRTYGHLLASQYVVIDLLSGRIRAANALPTGFSSEWWAYGGAEWSEDGKAVLLPDAYPKSGSADQSVASPCASVFYPESGSMQCLQPLNSRFTNSIESKPKAFVIEALRFARGRSDKVIMRYTSVNRYHGIDGSGERVFKRSARGTWRMVASRKLSGSPAESLRISVKQGLNEPPVVAISDLRAKASRVIWDPNRQLKHIALGQATAYHWQDATGREWTGGLYKPPNYVPGRRYPLVIQTHGFPNHQFRPSGLYPPAFAARALAADGIIVLQTPLCPLVANARVGPCIVAGFEAAVRHLASQGLIDPSRVGVIGFSATVYYVLESLTASSVRFAAASVTDGVEDGYMQYLESADRGQEDVGHYFDALTGAKPFGSGLQLWVKRSPAFNMQRVRTPLLVVGAGRASVLFMWEPYAALLYLGKPVDLVQLNSDEHLLTEPAVRLVSQGGSVDWFRFWLQGYESPHPVMSGEYRRWEKLCDMQIEENPGRPTFCVPTKDFRAHQFKAQRPALQ